MAACRFIHNYGLTLLTPARVKSLKNVTPPVSGSVVTLPWSSSQKSSNDPASAHFRARTSSLYCWSGQDEPGPDVHPGTAALVSRCAASSMANQLGSTWGGILTIYCIIQTNPQIQLTTTTQPLKRHCAPHRIIPTTHINPTRIHTFRQQRRLRIKDPQTTHHLINLIIMRKRHRQWAHRRIRRLSTLNRRIRPRAQQVHHALNHRQHDARVAERAWACAVPVSQVLAVLVLQDLLGREDVAERRDLPRDLRLEAAEVREIADVVGREFQITRDEFLQACRDGWEVDVVPDLDVAGAGLVVVCRARVGGRQAVGDDGGVGGENRVHSA